VPEGAHGRFEIAAGLLDGGRRLELQGKSAGHLRYLLGAVEVAPTGAITYLSPEFLSDKSAPFARADRGWAQDLCETDRFIKNTYEVLSWLNRLTATEPMLSHRFLTPDRLVEETEFGGGVKITVNFGAKPYRNENYELPQYGFVVESPTFVACYASEYAGKRFVTPTLYTLRSLDGKPLLQSQQVRVFHGFGDTHLAFAGRDFEVERQAVINFAGK